MFSETAVLIVVANGKDAKGFPVETKTEYTVYVREKSATRTEFYEAMRAGVKVSIVFEVRIEDWVSDATRIRYDGTEYDIIRTYRNDKSMIELICA